MTAGSRRRSRHLKTAIDRAPHLAVPRYNAAATLFQLKQYAQALERYQEARLRAGPLLRTKIDYALGNTSLALGEIAAAIRAYDDCLASTASGEQVEQVRRDAAINRKFAVEQAESPAIADNENPEAPRARHAGAAGAGPNPRPDGEDTSPDAQPDSGAGRRRRKPRTAISRTSETARRIAADGPAAAAAPEKARRDTAEIRPTIASTPPSSTFARQPKAVASPKNFHPISRRRGQGLVSMPAEKLDARSPLLAVFSR